MVDSSLPKASAKALFDALGIERVICIDDEYVPLLADDVIGLCTVLEKDHCKNVPEFKSIDFDKTEAIWKAALRKVWDGLGKDDRLKLGNQLQQDVATKDGTEFSTTSPMGELLDFIDLRPLAPDEWTAQRETLLAEAKDHPTLFLFDKDLSKANLGEEGGITLLKQAIANDVAICGMLSHHFSVEQEYDIWKGFIGEHQIAGDRFILISKQHLQPQNWFGFARMLKLTMLNTPCRKLADLLSDRMRSGIDAAKTNVSAISVYDFEDIVFRKSQGEGVWEADTLFRILSLYQKKELRGKAGTNQDIHDLVSTIRKVLNVKTHEDFSSRQTSRQIQRLEWYEESEEVNSHFLPIGLGDVFHKTAGTKKYMLLCQPCDLMVRKNGRRNYELADVFLAEITEKYNKDAAFKKLKFFDPESQKIYYVNFQCRVAVSLDVLDLCALNPEGKAVYTKGPVANNLLIPSWTKRSEEVGQLYEKAMNNMTNPPQQTKEVMAEKMPRASRDGRFVKGVFNQTDTITYPVQRIGRVCSPFADDILGAFCSYLSRPAFGMELTEDEIVEDATCEDGTPDEASEAPVTPTTTTH